MRFHLTSHAPSVILQLPAGTAKRVSNREGDICVSLIAGRRRADVDLASVGKAQAYTDMKKSACMLVSSRVLETDVAGCQASVHAFQLADMIGDLLL